VFPNVTADTYSVEITMDGFKILTRKNVVVSAGDRVTVPSVTLEVGGPTESVNVVAHTPMVQASSGERSFAVATEEIANLPINRGNFTSVTALTPGVVAGGPSAGGTRLGGAGQNNIMMDGISAMDTGANSQMLAMSIESIGEVKVLTQGYQAEYGRSSGLQITAVTKGGTNQFRGSAFDVQTDSDWNANSWVNVRNGDPKLKATTKTLGYSIGGPAGKPGGSNKLFFFYSHEYRPVTSPINNGNPIRLRVPTLLERTGDFSQTLNTNTSGQSTGVLNPFIKDPNSTLPCSAANTAGCFQDGGVVGKIPASRQYAPGIAILNRYPPPTMAQSVNTTHNYEVLPPSVSNLTQQPAVRLDYQLSAKLRFTGKYSGQRARRVITPGTIQGFNDTLNPYPYITNYGVTVNYTMTPTTFVEGTYGFIRNQIGIIPVNESADRLTSLPGFPLLYEEAGRVDERYFVHTVMQDLEPSWWDGTSMNLPPVFGWGNRIGTPPPNQQFLLMNINRTQDVAVSITKVAGRHAMKAGFYNNHSYKAQNTGTGGVLNLSFQGFVNFANDTNNTLDTSFGFANAAAGVFTQYLQQSKLIEGSMIYNNTEFYLQDNWKVTPRLTLDYGLRFTHQQPQYDQFQQMSNFFPDLWSAAAAPVLYVPGCTGGAATCPTGNNRNAMDPRTGQILTAPGTANTAAMIGTPIPGTDNPTNGIRQAGDGIAKTSYTWPAMVLGPRFGFAYDVSGTQSVVIRGGAGLYYDRPDGNTVFSIPGNPPLSSSQDLRNGQLQTLGGLRALGVPLLSTYEYDSRIPASIQWQIGAQVALPWASMVDVSYVGNHGYDRLGAFQGQFPVNLNAVDFGAAYLAANQDPTLAGTNPTPGAQAYVTNLLRPFRGLSAINQQTADFHDTYHSIQSNFNRRFRNGVQLGLNYTLSLSYTGNTLLQKRLQHGADGSISLRSDQQAYEDLNKNLNLLRHVIKGSGVWDLPDVKADSGGLKVLALLANDWQLSGVLTAGSTPKYDLTYAYTSNGLNVNLTGSPDYAAKIIFTGDPGKGCSSDPYRQFNAAAVTGPTYNSLGLESGRNLMTGCPDHTVDLSLMRAIRLGGSRQLQFRLDAFNAFNTVIINGRQTQITYNNPVDKVITNSQTLPDGSIDPNRLTPRTAGFGAATSALTMRNLQLAIRFSF
jgi:hypothetical protein